MPALADIIQRTAVISSMGLCAYGGLLIAQGFSVRQARVREEQEKMLEAQLHPEMAAGSLAKPESMPS
ncbi:hypothetical protein JCM24511_01449 [Saitozyma sp. JCM 24511]|nr:hypothetical protein JCM24511_01449 [Saitozyma sp. JCM 24511]